MHNSNLAPTHVERITLIKNSRYPRELIEHVRWVMEKSQSDILCDQAEHEEVFKTAFSKYATMTTLFSSLEKDTLCTALKRYRNKIILVVDAE